MAAYSVLREESELPMTSNMGEPEGILIFLLVAGSSRR